jgi:hypothetical protein
MQYNLINIVKQIVMEKRYRANPKRLKNFKNNFIWDKNKIEWKKNNKVYAYSNDIKTLEKYVNIIKQSNTKMTNVNNIKLKKIINDKDHILYNNVKVKYQTLDQMFRLGKHIWNL